MPEYPPRPLTPRESALDVRIWRWPSHSMPLLLVNASRKQGHAVLRNRFRRRVRMAFLDLLRRRPVQEGLVVWVRPAKGSRLGCNIPYAEIADQLELALRRWKP
ncbi:MAG: ribonuclease P protein component [Firmicutes bacterium]|nr:ribonuclease P protein component [Bacillota bacterium]